VTATSTNLESEMNGDRAVFLTCLIVAIVFAVEALWSLV